MRLLHDIISQKQKVAMFSVDPFSAQRGLCALTKYNGSTDSTNYDNSQHRLGTHSVVCRLVHTIRAVSTGKVSRRPGAYFQQGNSAREDWCLCQCVSPHRAVHNRSVSVCQSSPCSSQQICISVSVLTEQFTTNLYQCVSLHRAVHNKSVSVCQSSSNISQQICISDCIELCET